MGGTVWLCTLVNKGNYEIILYIYTVMAQNAESLLLLFLHVSSLSDATIGELIYVRDVALLCWLYRQTVMCD